VADLAEWKVQGLAAGSVPLSNVTITIAERIAGCLQGIAIGDVGEWGCANVPDAIGRPPNQRTTRPASDGPDGAKCARMTSRGASPCASA